MVGRLQGLKEGFTLQSIYLLINLLFSSVLKMADRLQGVKEGYTPRSHLVVNESIVKMCVLELAWRVGCRG